jgi:hypothetical protein
MREIIRLSCFLCCPSRLIAGHPPQPRLNRPSLTTISSAPLAVTRTGSYAIAPYRSSADAIATFPTTATAVGVSAAPQGERVITGLPITHAPPADPDLAVEIPPTTKRRLGLDDERSWVVLSGANRFVWPGPDLRPARRGDAVSIAYGVLPYALFETIRQRFVAAIGARRAGVVPRSE